jgi:ABC-2 type transport system ATP-binding protein
VKTTVLRTENLTKHYGKKTAVAGVSLEVFSGEIYGFLGPNGAGKTTVMRMILGLSAPSKGSVSIFGVPFGGDYTRIRNRIGAASEVPYLYPDMTAAEYLLFFGALYGVSEPRAKVKAILERFGLLEVAAHKLKTFSQGMQQRINLARAFVHDPELIFLDEPVGGLDPRWIKEVRDLVSEVRNAGRTVFISSHLLSIVESVCDRVAIIDRGRLLAEDAVEAVKGKLTDQVTLNVEVTAVNERLLQALRSLPFVRSVKQAAGFLELQADKSKDIRERISKRITEAGGTILAVQYKEPSLEDAFLELTENSVSRFKQQPEPDV